MPKNKSQLRLSSVNGSGRRWATKRECAAHLKVTIRTVEHMVADGRLTQYNLGPRIARFDLDEVDAAFQTRA